MVRKYNLCLIFVSIWKFTDHITFVFKKERQISFLHLMCKRHFLGENSFHLRLVPIYHIAHNWAIAFSSSILVYFKCQSSGCACTQRIRFTPGTWIHLQGKRTVIGLRCSKNIYRLRRSTTNCHTSFCTPSF